MNQEHVDQISRTLGSGLSRRGVLRTLRAVGASGLLAVVGHEAMAADRPHEILQDRTEQRNRKQRNNNKNNNNNRNNKNNTNDTNDGGGSQLGAGDPVSSQICQDQCQEQFDGCTEPCNNSVCLGICQDRQNDCLTACANA
jgi:hypothetical protein